MTQVNPAAEIPPYHTFLKGTLLFHQLNQANSLCQESDVYKMRVDCPLLDSPPAFAIDYETVRHHCSDVPPSPSDYAVLHRLS